MPTDVSRIAAPVTRAIAVAMRGAPAYSGRFEASRSRTFSDCRAPQAPETAQQPHPTGPEWAAVRPAQAKPLGPLRSKEVTLGNGTKIKLEVASEKDIPELREFYWSVPWNDAAQAAVCADADMGIEVRDKFGDRADVLLRMQPGSHIVVARATVDGKEQIIGTGMIESCGRAGTYEPTRAC